MESQAKRQGFLWGGLLILLGVVLLIESFTNLGVWIWVGLLSVAGLGALGFYFVDRSNWGLLIPTYVLWAIAALIALIALNLLRDEFIATYVLEAIALPFVIGFLRDVRNWGLLIPAYVLLAVGIMIGLIGVGVLVDLLIPAYVLLAVALPFFVVYVVNPREWWPLIPGGITAAIGISFLIASAAAQYIGPIALIVVGAWILLRQLLGRGRRREADGPPAE